MSGNDSQLFVLAYEEGYSTANDPFVLGHPAPTDTASSTAINRYLIAGAVYGEYVDKGLWRVRPNAMQRLLKRLLKNHDVYGFNGAGDLRRLPAAWAEKVVYSQAGSTERIIGGKTFVQARDVYLVKLDESVIEDFGAPSLGDAWFQSLFVAVAGTPVVTAQFREVAALLGRGPRPEPAAIAKALELFDGIVCYSYPETPKNVDGPQLVIYSSRSWRALLVRVFGPVEGQTCLFLDLSRGSPTSLYALDFYPTVLFAKRSVG